MDADFIFVGQGELDTARAMVDSTGHDELLLYPGAQHDFADSGLPSCDAVAPELPPGGVLTFLANVDAAWRVT